MWWRGHTGREATTPPPVSRQPCPRAWRGSQRSSGALRVAAYTWPWAGSVGRAPVALQAPPRPRPPGRPVGKPASCSAALLRLCFGATGKRQKQPATLTGPRNPPLDLEPDSPASRDFPQSRSLLPGPCTRPPRFLLFLLTTSSHSEMKQVGQTGPHPLWWPLAPPSAGPLSTFAPSVKDG